MRYACQIWGLCDNSITHRILTLQNTALRLITFNAPRTSATPLFAQLRILKFFDLVKLLNILYVHQYFNGSLPLDTLNTLKFSKTNHSIGTRGNRTNLLSRQNVNTTYFGLHSFTRISTNIWNTLQESFPDLNLTELSYSKLKSLSSRFFLNRYKEQ